MILADSSAWVEYDRATGSPVDQRMTALIADGGPLTVTEPVLMEVLAGARDARRESDLRRLLMRCQVLSVEVPTDFEAAARVYRRCRSAGTTPRGLLDCLIAAVAWRRGASVLAHDADLARVAAVIGIAMDPASSPA